MAETAYSSVRANRMAGRKPDGTAGGVCPPDQSAGRRWGAGRTTAFRLALFLLVLAGADRAVSGRHASAADPVPSHGKAEKRDSDVAKKDVAKKDVAKKEAVLLTHIRQLTFEGRRSGEGYFRRDGKQMVFQSEREPGNPFFQIYLMDIETGDVRRVSPGRGKTTCAWIHPREERILFASTHADPAAARKQQEELARRAAGKSRRYAWDFDENFDLFQVDLAAGELGRLTRAVGYDAEGSWSPDGRFIAFASNRRAYSQPLAEPEKKAFAKDPSVLMDIYIMAADGSAVRRLTSELGYDGGPFFSPDGGRIVWRRFSEEGATAEIWTMNTDGTDQRQITRLQAMSWAPFYHPSGRYLIFTTNRHGFGNFELYLVDTDGRAAPVRVTYTSGFDGLPVFTPDGRHLAWTTTRTASGQAQIFIADWNDEAARALLAIDAPGLAADVAAGWPAAETTASAGAAAIRSAARTETTFSPQDILRHVDYLCRPELEGRRTGTRGEKLATAYVAAYLDYLELEPAGDEGTWFQEFTFTSGVALGTDNTLGWGDRAYRVDKQWRPLAFSRAGKVAAAPVVCAGYGITAPATDEHDAYDSYTHLDVHGKWVLIFRFLPEQCSPSRRQQLAPYSSLRRKAMLARDLGAGGLLVASGPNSEVRDELVRLRFDGSLAGSSIPVVSVTDAVAQAWLASAGRDLQALQDRLDAGEASLGFELAKVRLAASIDIKRISKKGRNVLGWLRVRPEPAEPFVVVGAHVDHLGVGTSSSSLARGTEKTDIHYGADDNASGVAALLEIAQYLAHLRTEGKLKAKHDVLFAAWSGEELGLLGSSYFLKSFAANQGRVGGPNVLASAGLHASIAACLNLDMVGRLDQALILQGTGSSSLWPREIERRNAPVGLSIKTQNDSYIPTDASAFFLQGVPILSAFTGSHEDYHTPRDTPEKLNYDGAAKIARFMGLVARSLARAETVPDFLPQSEPGRQRRANLRAYLGTIPDYTESDVAGVRLSGVAAGGPADKAGLAVGDVIVRLAGKKIENIYDYTFAIEALKIGRTAKIVVVRDGQHLTRQITPASRE